MNPPPRRRLVIPARLAWSAAVLATVAGCPSASPTDAASDAPTDIRDVAIGDAPAADADAADDADACVPQPFAAGYFQCMLDPRASDAGACTGQYVCSAAECEAGCVACPTVDFRETGYTCLPTRGADVATACPPARVCNASDCPSGCDACSEPAFCTPDPTMDASGVRCDPQIVCDPSGCPPGCLALV